MTALAQRDYSGSVRGASAVDQYLHHREAVQMKTKSFFVRILATGCFFAGSMLLPSVGHAQVDPRVGKSMETLKVMTAKLGAPKLEGKEAIGGKDAPALYFGTTKINNNFDIVDAIGKEDGKGDRHALRKKRRRIHPRLDERTETRRKRTSDRYCSGRAGARIDQGGQSVLRRGAHSGYTLRNGL
jgi:hypothetical protein